MQSCACSPMHVVRIYSMHVSEKEIVPDQYLQILSKTHEFDTYVVNSGWNRVCHQPLERERNKRVVLTGSQWPNRQGSYLQLVDSPQEVQWQAPCRLEQPVRSFKMTHVLMSMVVTLSSWSPNSVVAVSNKTCNYATYLLSVSITSGLH